MKRLSKWYLRTAVLLASLFSAFPVLAQTTVVTGTVTDSSGTPYSGGTILAQLVLAGAGVTGQPVVTVNNTQQCISAGQGSAPCKLPFTATVGPVSLDSTGSFTLTLQDNTLVTPAATQWSFTVSAPGVLPPVGTGPQSATPAPITISGASMNITTFGLNSSPSLLRTPVFFTASSIAATLNLTVGTAGAGNNFINISGNSSPTVTLRNGTGALGGNAVLDLGTSSGIKAAFFQGSNVCTSTANPASCFTRPVGRFVIAAGATTTQINTDEVTASGSIFVVRDDSLGTALSVTCNTQSSLVLGTPRALSRSVGSNFIATIDVAPTTNPLCLVYFVVN